MFPSHDPWGGLYGTIKNFSWSAQKDGSYDCKIEVVGAGDILESLRANQNSEKATARSLAKGGGKNSYDSEVEDDATDEGGWFGSDQTDDLPAIVSQRYASTFENILFAYYEYAITKYSQQEGDFFTTSTPEIITTTGRNSKSAGWRNLINNVFKPNSPYKFLSIKNDGTVEGPDAPTSSNLNEYFGSRGNSYHVIRQYQERDGDEEIEEAAKVDPRIFNIICGAFNDKGEDARNKDGL